MAYLKEKHDGKDVLVKMDDVKGYKESVTVQDLIEILKAKGVISDNDFGVSQ